MVTVGPGVYRGFNLHTKVPRVRLDGSPCDVKVDAWHYRDTTLHLVPPDDAPSMDAWAARAEELLAERVRIDQLLDTHWALLDDFRVRDAPHQKPEAERHERDWAGRLGYVGD